MADATMQYLDAEEFDAMQLLALDVGDVIELEALLPGLSDEGVVGMVTAKTADEVTIKLTYYGVWLANYKFTKKGKQWNKV